MCLKPQRGAGKQPAFAKASADRPGASAFCEPPDGTDAKRSPERAMEFGRGFT
jgi:hypothetical protein